MLVPRRGDGRVADFLPFVRSSLFLFSLFDPSSLSQQKPPAKKSFDKATRLPRNELLDLLFSLFETHTYWSLKGLKEKTRQPESYLKEVLGEIANMVRRGPYNGTWALMEVYKPKKEENADGVKSEQGGKEEVKGEAVVGGMGGNGVSVLSESGGMGGEGEEDDSDEDDEDMEEL